MLEEKVLVILPCLNEKESINKVIDGLRPEWDVLVADGGSTDGTLGIIKRGHIECCPRKGKGLQINWIHQNMIEQWEFAKAYADTAYIVMLDSDNTYPTQYITSMLDKLRGGEYDIIVGKRIPEKGAMSNIHKIGNFLLTLAANILYKQKTQDLCSGYLAFTRRAWQSIEIRAKGFDLEANIFTEANKKNLRLGWIPTKYRARQGSKPKLRMGHGFTILKWLLKEKLV